MEQLQTLLTGALEARGRVLVKLNVEEANLDGGHRPAARAEVADGVEAVRRRRLRGRDGRRQARHQHADPRAEGRTARPASSRSRSPRSSSSVVTRDACHARSTSSAGSARSRPTTATVYPVPLHGDRRRHAHDRGRHRRRVRGRAGPPRAVGSRRAITPASSRRFEAGAHVGPIARGDRERRGVARRALHAVCGSCAARLRTSRRCARSRRASARCGRRC